MQRRIASEGARFVMEHLLEPVIHPGVKNGAAYMTGAGVAMVLSGAPELSAPSAMVNYFASMLDTSIDMVLDQKETILKLQRLNPMALRKGLLTMVAKSEFNRLQFSQQQATVYAGACGILGLDLALLFTFPPAGVAGIVYCALGLMLDAAGVYAAGATLQAGMPDSKRMSLAFMTKMKALQNKRFYNIKFDPSQPMIWYDWAAH